MSDGEMFAPTVMLRKWVDLAGGASIPPGQKNLKWLVSRVGEHEYKRLVTAGLVERA